MSFHPFTTAEFARVRHQELIREADQSRLARQARSTRRWRRALLHRITLASRADAGAAAPSAAPDFPDRPRVEEQPSPEVPVEVKVDTQTTAAHPDQSAYLTQERQSRSMTSSCRP